ncbi:MAG: bifunctional phosphoribosylaminoimidazolecarboxamide formyltransferase/IMP cyclohydrolase [Candidatus Omnitrophica bacterium]|nr:bifunctional phosphoribosylaminoimidazolecarboxamide formyltransferase/IMP cyclohydrolase [Candidatus Omnitrophota bacterium]
MGAVVVRIRRALISVSDKRYLDDFVRGLQEFGVEILSTGGTAQYIQSLGLSVRPVSDVTGFPEMLDGRVKTLHPKIHGGILARRDIPAHVRQAEAAAIPLIDMVVVNLYPFEETVAQAGVSEAAAIENIDIGGPAMLRSAAKNGMQVCVLCDPARYAAVLADMRRYDGCVGPELLRACMAEVFERTAAYDAAIAAYFQASAAQPPTGLPQRLHLQFERVHALRYGENPHQQAAVYRQCGAAFFGVVNARQLHGKELSFNNFLDMDAAVALVREFREPAAGIIKHNNPCGVAVAATAAEACRRALEGDPLSAFGSIVGLNRPVDEAAAAAILAADFVECIIAPGYAAAALALLRQKKNLRLMEIPEVFVTAPQAGWDYKRLSGGLLVQSADTAVAAEESMRTVTRRHASPEERRSLLFAWNVVKHVKSNAIVLAQQTQAVGIGAGQMSRVDSVMIAVRKAGARTAGAVMASDAFFPKDDSVIEAARAGITAVIQPGGSIRDPEVIAAADQAGLAMIFTGMRHFKH